MNGDAGGPLAGLSWGTIVATFGAVATPCGLAIAWVFNQGRSGSQLTITGQAGLIATLQAENAEQVKRIETLEERIDKQGAEIDQRRDDLHQLRGQMQSLIAQMVRAGITPAA